MRTADIALADAILTDPVNPAFASLNLAQAVLLAGFAWMTSDGAALPFGRKTKWPPAEALRRRSAFGPPR
jgi:tRNA/rRNA methyltransferase